MAMETNKTNFTSILFGNIEIACKTTSQEEQQGYDFATYDIATGKPVISKVGMQLKNITLNISLRQYNDFDIKETLEQIKGMFESGNANTLIIGDEIKGEFVIKNIRRQTKNIATDGKILSSDITLELLEYEPRQVLETKKVEQKSSTQKTPTKRKSTGKVNEPVKKQEQSELYKIEIKNLPESTYVKPAIL